MLRLAAGVRDVIFPVRGSVRRTSFRYLTLLAVLPVLAAGTWAFAAGALGVETGDLSFAATTFAIVAGGLLLHTMFMLRTRMSFDAKRKRDKVTDLRTPMLLDETATMALWGATVALGLMFATVIAAALIPVGAPFPVLLGAAFVLTGAHLAGCLTHTITATLTTYRVLAA